MLTRPFTLAITMLTSIDSVMTVLIARDLLETTELDESSALLGAPAIMLGIGLVIGQAIYGALGSRIGPRKLVVNGAIAMLLCACLTGGAVASGNFWFYCAAKLVMAVPFGMLYVLFSINTTLVWSMVVIAIVALLCKATDGWKALWMKAAREAGMPPGRATGTMFSSRCLALVVQPFILSMLIGAADNVAVIVIGVICLACAAAFYLLTRHTTIATDTQGAQGTERGDVGGEDKGNHSSENGRDEKGPTSV